MDKLRTRVMILGESDNQHTGERRVHPTILLKSLRCKPEDWNMGGAAMAAHKWRQLLALDELDMCI